MGLSDAIIGLTSGSKLSSNLFMTDIGSLCDRKFHGGFGGQYHGRSICSRDGICCLFRMSPSLFCAHQS